MRLSSALALILLLALAHRIPATPISVCAVEYGLVTCPHCLRMKDILNQTGIPLVFIDIDVNRTDMEEYRRLYSALVGGTYYVPLTVLIANGSAKLVVVGERDSVTILKLLAIAVANESAVLVSPSPDEVRWVTDRTLISVLNAAVKARAPVPATISLATVRESGVAKLTTPFGTPMAGANVLVLCPDGFQYEARSDSAGRIELLCRNATLAVRAWMGFPVNFTAPASPGAVIAVRGLGRIIVVARDILGRPIVRASARLFRNNVEMVGETGGEGLAVADLPAGTYALAVSKGWKSVSLRVEVASELVSSVEVRLDVLYAADGFSIGLTEMAAAAAVALVAAWVVLRFGRRGSTSEESLSSQNPEPRERDL